jgi:hypothetical protein
MKFLLLLAFFMTVILACNDGANTTTITADTTITDQTSASRWDSTNRNSFLFECMEGTKRENMSEEAGWKYCNCMLRKIEQRYPIPDSANVLTDTTAVLAIRSECL